MNDLVQDSIALYDSLGKAETVLTLFLAAAITSFYNKRLPKGFIFFLFAVILPFFGVLSSKDLMDCLINKVTTSLLCLYLVILGAIETGCIQKILEFLYKISKGRSLRFYLALTAFSSFFPSKRIEKQIMQFLRHQKSLTLQTTHILLPILIVLASSLTLLGSITNLVSDYIVCEFLKGQHWGLFSHGMVSLSLFAISFVFFFSVVKMQKIKGTLLKLKLTLSIRSKEGEILYKTSSVEFSNSTSTFKEQVEAHRDPFLHTEIRSFSPFVKKATMFIFVSMIILSCLGIRLFCLAPAAFIILFFLGSFEKKGILQRLPWDVFLLVIAAFLFSLASIETRLPYFAAEKLSILRTPISQMTFFLFTSAILSLCIPSVLIMSLLVPIAFVMSAKQSSAYTQHLITTVTLGSFFLFPKKSLISFDKLENSQPEQIELLKIQALWILIVYAVFVIHTLAIT